ncbi:MAG: hypothetical protein KAJ09_11325, partial [Deltaproteobacteria bacterium]|nr:hypothetical protein [Deltaproteobacteria bacterium]
MREKLILVTLIIGVFLFLPVSPSMVAQVMGSPKGDDGVVVELIESWREELERKGLNYYLSRYGSPLPKAGKKGRSERVDITIDDVRVFKRDDGIITTTFLRRANSRRFQDVGVGVLSFRRENGQWRVDGEEWYPVSEDAVA